MCISRRYLAILSLVALVLLVGSAAPGQNYDLRLGSIERRIDQVQSRVDSVEREQRMLSFSSTTRPEVSRETVIELQRQQNSLAEQVVMIEQRMLEVRKTIDRISSELNEKKEESKPKAAEAPKRRP